MNLWQIDTQLQAKLQELGEMLVSESEPSNAQIDALLELESDRDDKLIAYGYVVHNEKADIKVIDDEIKRLQEIKKKKTKLCDTLSERMLECMGKYEIKELKRPTLTIKLAKAPPKVLINKPLDDLPQEFIRVKTETTADKIALAKAIKGGTKIDGVELVQDTVLKIS